MQVHREINENWKLKDTVLTIGTFDGVHKGHVAIVEKLISTAKKLNAESVVVSFDPHPRSVIYPKDNTLSLLTNLEEKIELFSKLGVDHLVIYPFSFEFSRISAEEYIERFLLDRFEPKGIVVGFDHKFGLNRTGNFDLLQQYAERYNFELFQIEKKTMDELKISSTFIREALQKGEIKSANQRLGYNYSFNGLVIKGNNIGEKLGYPTANLKIAGDKKLIPAAGIYAAFTFINDERYDGLLYIGNKPSIAESDEIFIEIHIKEFKGYLYGENIKVELIEFVRGDEKFDSMEILKAQIQADDMNIMKILQSYKNTSI